jgi:hypothetical protein
MNIIEAHKEAKKSSYRIINAAKNKIIDFNNINGPEIIRLDENGKIISSFIIERSSGVFIKPLLDIINDDWEVVEK